MFDSPLATLGMKTSQPATLFDARGFPQDYAQGKSLFWFGELALDVSKEKPVAFDVDWVFQPKPVSDAKTDKLSLTVSPDPKVIAPDEAPPLIIPQPTTNQSASSNQTLEIKGRYDFPAGHVRFWEQDFVGSLHRLFEVPAHRQEGAPTISCGWRCQQAGISSWRVSDHDHPEFDIRSRRRGRRAA